MATVIPARSEVAAEHTWDAQSIFATEEAWEAAFKSFDASLASLSGFRGTLGSSPERLLEWLNTFFTSMTSLMDVYQYAMMFSVVDNEDQVAAGRTARASGLYARTLGAIAFSTPELLEIDSATISKWMTENSDLAIYKHYFNQIEEQRPHTRSAEVQQLLGAVVEPFSGPSTIHSLLSDSEIKFKSAVGSDGVEHEITQMTIDLLLNDEDREVRRTAWENYADGYLGVKNSLAACLASTVQQDVFQARAANFQTSMEHWLHGYNCPKEVFLGVIDAFKSNIPVWHRYFDVLRKALGVETLHVYDLTAPLSKSAPAVSYQQSIEWICEGMAPLGDEYVSDMKRGLLQDRWVDVFPNKGKNMGAFSSGHQGSRPFIFMSYDDKLFGMSTLAHELGHSMHSWLAWKTQPPVYSGCGSEVPSNFNQAMTRAYLFDTVKDKDFQVALIEEAMANFYRYFLIMPTLARFELEIHTRIEQGQALTADGMNELMASLFQEAFGEKVTADTARLGSIWAQFPTHIHGNIFMFVYTVGIAGAHALAEPILAGVPGAAEKYVGYLKGGASVYEFDGLKSAGVDMTSPEPIVKTFKVLEQLVERLESLVC